MKIFLDTGKRLVCSECGKDIEPLEPKIVEGNVYEDLEWLDVYCTSECRYQRTDDAILVAMWKRFGDGGPNPYL